MLKNLKQKRYSGRLNFDDNYICLINSGKKVVYNSSTIILAKSKLQISSSSSQQDPNIKNLIDQFIKKFQLANELLLKMKQLHSLHLIFDHILIDEQGLEYDNSEILNVFLKIYTRT